MSKPSLQQSLTHRGYAARMRGAGTAAERLLWEQLRAGRLGVHFRRQVPLLGRYVVDFLAVGPRLVVEVDGLYHSAAKQQRADALRDRRLHKAGYLVLRLSNQQVLGDIAAIVRRIKAATEA